jgi:hypothetical protein
MYQLRRDSAYFVLRLSVIISIFITESILTIQPKIKCHTLRNTIHSLSRNTADDVAIKLKKITSMLLKVTIFSNVHYNQSLRDAKVSEVRVASALQVRVIAML